MGWTVDCDSKTNKDGYLKFNKTIIQNNSWKVGFYFPASVDVTHVDFVVNAVVATKFGSDGTFLFDFEQNIDGEDNAVFLNLLPANTDSVTTTGEPPAANLVYEIAYSVDGAVDHRQTLMRGSLTILAKSEEV